MRVQFGFETSNSIVTQQSYPQHLQKIYRSLLPPWRRTGAYCVQRSAVLLLVLVLLGYECQTAFSGPR